MAQQGRTNTLEQNNLKKRDLNVETNIYYYINTSYGAFHSILEVGFSEFKANYYIRN